MKKFFVIALAAMSMTFVSCKKSVEAQAEAYVQQVYEASQKNDIEGMMKIAKEAEEWMNGLSAEDKAKAEAAAEKKSIALGMKEEHSEEAAEEAEAAVEEVAEAVDSLAAAVEEAVAE
ncbi:MAG: hypothetical protein MJZ60_03240 [Bacteroidaceae bacterium]|nr:hypothetical protein [Bacteroidaceae bacterium]